MYCYIYTDSFFSSVFTATNLFSTSLIFYVVTADAEIIVGVVVCLFDTCNKNIRHSTDAKEVINVFFYHE